MPTWHCLSTGKGISFETGLCKAKHRATRFGNCLPCRHLYITSCLPWMRAYCSTSVRQSEWTVHFQLCVVSINAHVPSTAQGVHKTSLLGMLVKLPWHETPSHFNLEETSGSLILVTPISDQLFLSVSLYKWLRVLLFIFSIQSFHNIYMAFLFFWHHVIVYYCTTHHIRAILLLQSLHHNILLPKLLKNRAASLRTPNPSPFGAFLRTSLICLKPLL